MQADTSAWVLPLQVNTMDLDTIPIAFDLSTLILWWTKGTHTCAYTNRMGVHQATARKPRHFLGIHFVCKSKHL